MVAAVLNDDDIIFLSQRLDCPNHLPAMPFEDVRLLPLCDDLTADSS
jgi:hypothetical protein